MPDHEQEAPMEHGDMDTSDGEFFIGPAEQGLFDIADTRERADRLRDGLTPKLASLLDEAWSEVKDAYGAEALESCRISLTPANRPGAKNTKAFDEATAGLALEGQHWYFQIRLVCSRSGLLTTLFGLRGHEANPIVSILQRYKSEVIQLLDHAECFLWSRQHTESLHAEEYDLSRRIEALTQRPDGDWGASVFIKGPDYELPVSFKDDAFPNVYDFVGLFPIFRAAANILQGRDDSFPTYLRQFWAWDAKRREDDSHSTPDDEGEAPSLSDGSGALPLRANREPQALEGELKLALRRHRKRERRLRKAKIDQARREGDGRLRCEVPGCGFDFFEVYDELGERFAHVHHTKPLSGSSRPQVTWLRDLAIVCANCHAMIHRYGACRELADLIPQRG